MDAYILGVNLFGVEASGTVVGPARPVGDALRSRSRARGVFFEWVTKVVRMLESAAKAAGCAIKNFFEGVGCEIASWFGSDCKDRMVDAEVTQQENVERRRGVHDPDRDVLPAEAQRAAAAGQARRQGRHDVLRLNVGTRNGNRGVEPTATRREVHDRARRRHRRLRDACG